MRKLIALEQIGLVNTICSDKTGTLTQGKMFLKSVWCAGTEYNVSGIGYSPVGEILQVGGDSTALMRENMPVPLAKLTLCAALCNMSVIKRKGKSEFEESKALIKPHTARSLFGGKSP